MLVLLFIILACLLIFGDVAIVILICLTCFGLYLRYNGKRQPLPSSNVTGMEALIRLHDIWYHAITDIKLQHMLEQDIRINYQSTVDRAKALSKHIDNNSESTSVLRILMADKGKIMWQDALDGIKVPDYSIMFSSLSEDDIRQKYKNFFYNVIAMCSILYERTQNKDVSAVFFITRDKIVWGGPLISPNFTPLPTTYEEMDQFIEQMLSRVEKGNLLWLPQLKVVIRKQNI